jgi:hypothetical protein
VYGKRFNPVSVSVLEIYLLQIKSVICNKCSLRTTQHHKGYGQDCVLQVTQEVEIILSDGNQMMNCVLKSGSIVIKTRMRKTGNLQS